MRSRIHMTALLAAVALSSVSLQAVPPPEPRRPTGKRPGRVTVRAIRDTGKAPTNGAREVERRLKQAARKAAKDLKRGKTSQEN